jgi:predicted nucleic acid-binding protein
MILPDTSTWIEHLDSPDPKLSEALLEDQVLVHPWVLGELSLADFKRRAEFLGQLSLQSEAPVIHERELMKLIEKERLRDSGIGWVDCQILASALAMRANLMTHDKALKRAWDKVKRA